MNIALVGDFAEPADEGMRRLCADLRTGVAAQHLVLALNASELRQPAGLARLRGFRPAVLHWITSPTIFSLITLKVCKVALGRRVITIATGLKPFLGPCGRRLLRAVRPDVYLAQSRRWVALFRDAGSQVLDFPNWVSVDKFRLGDPSAKPALREKYGLPKTDPLVLHVGHVKPNRNLECLIPVQNSSRYRVVIIGSQSLSENGPCLGRLRAAGILVISGYVPAIQEVYQACDFYALTARALPPDRFPGNRHSLGVIDFPLSILEAMASGTRVVTTRHDALQYFLGQPPGLRYFDGSGEDCLRALDEVATHPANTRAVAERFSLESAVGLLDSVYQQSRSRRAS